MKENKKKHTERNAKEIGKWIIVFFTFIEKRFSSMFRFVFFSIFVRFLGFYE